jgi:hypothetical protein
MKPPTPLPAKRPRREGNPKDPGHSRSKGSSKEERKRELQRDRVTQKHASLQHRMEREVTRVVGERWPEMVVQQDWGAPTPAEWLEVLEEVVAEWTVAASSAQTYVTTLYGVLIRKGARLQGITKGLLRALKRRQVREWVANLDQGTHPLDTKGVDVEALLEEVKGKIPDWMEVLLEASTSGTRITTIGDARRGQFRWMANQKEWVLGTFSDKGSFQPYPVGLRLSRAVQVRAKDLWGAKPASGRWTPKDFLEQMRKCLPKAVWGARGPRRQALRKWGKEMSPKEAAFLAHQKGEHTQRSYQGWELTKWEANRWGSTRGKRSRSTRSRR